ncbi:MAG: DEAD/DEAH box helicase family protein [Elusimicrobiota bacterium]
MNLNKLINSAMPDKFAEEILNLQLKQFHREWIWNIYHNNRVAIQAPTGFGKTTVAMAYVLWLITYHHQKQVLIISKSMPQSIKLLEAVKEEIISNPMLKGLIPKNKNSSWTKTEINTSTKCRVFCRPYSENVKGFHVDLIVCDEAASFHDVSIFYRFVVTRATAKNGKIVCISTPESITDLMAQLHTNPEYWSKVYKAEDEHGNSIWKERFSNSKLERIRAEIGEAAYQREYLCNPQAQRDRGVFNPSDIQECYDVSAKFEKVLIEEERNIFMGCDFAIASGKTADYDAYVIVERKGEFVKLIHGERHKGLPVASKVDRISFLYETYRPLRIIVDESMVGAAVIEELREKGIPVEGQDFSSKSRNKLLVDLSKLISNHKLLIPRSTKDEQALEFTNILTGELLGFVESKSKAQSSIISSEAPHDDTVMATALACKGYIESAQSTDYFASD